MGPIERSLWSGGRRAQQPQIRTPLTLRPPRRRLAALGFYDTTRSRPGNLSMEAAVASSVSGLRCSLSPIPKQQRRSARVGFMTRQRPYAVTCKRLPHPNPRFHAAAAAKASDAGSGGIRRKRLAVFVSGGGSNFRSIHDAALGGRVNGDVVALVTDKPGGDDACFLQLFGL